MRKGCAGAGFFVGRDRRGAVKGLAAGAAGKHELTEPAGAAETTQAEGVSYLETPDKEVFM